MISIFALHCNALLCDLSKELHEYNVDLDDLPFFVAMERGTW